MGASLICGPLGAPLGVFSGVGPTSEERARSVAFLQEVAPYAEERGVTIGARISEPLRDVSHEHRR